jgi:hypothetical protein
LILRYRDERRYLLHAFVIMPDHIHAIITPASDQSVERCMQCSKGGFSHALGKAGSRPQGIWQRGFHEHRIRDAEDYARHVSYIARNPERPDRWRMLLCLHAIRVWIRCLSTSEAKASYLYIRDVRAEARTYPVPAPP